MTKPPQGFEKLRDFSSWIGSDSTLVQGPGGNTSIKSKDLIWVKASGTKLVDAKTKDIFVSIDRQSGLPAPLDQQKKSSIETNLHILIDAPVVVHTHSTSALVAGFQEEIPDCVENNEKIAVVPYLRPGAALADGVRTFVDVSIHDYAILKNHGLLVWGRSVDEVWSKLNRFESEFKQLIQYSDKDLIEAKQILMTGNLNHYLTPDHAVFLDETTLEELSLESSLPNWLVEMYEQLSIVLASCKKSKNLSWLEREEVIALRDWDAEKMRKSSNYE
jgi:rhamnose utilization protein RhaD (predicted bifunctional aldolase and dehydrogenase)